MASQKAVELLKEIVKFAHKSSGFEQVLRHVSFIEINWPSSKFKDDKHFLDSNHRRRCWTMRSRVRGEEREFE